MEVIIATILEYAAIWGPALVAMLGTVAAVLTSIAKCKEAAEKLKTDPTITNLGKKFEAMAQQNEELMRCNKLLIDEITRIEGYADSKKHEVK